MNTQIICAPILQTSKSNTQIIKLKSIKQYLRKNNTSYEIIDNKKNELVKPYFDIDINDMHVGYDEIKKDKNKFLDTLKDKIKNTFKSNDLSIGETLYENKISYHIVCSDVKVKLLDFNKYMKHETTREYFKGLFIDYNVYKKYGKFRFIGCRKETEKSQMLPLTNLKNIYKHFITNIDDTQKFINLEIKKNDVINDHIKTIKPIILKSDNIRCTEERLEYICDALDISRYDLFDTWKDIMICVNNICNSNNYPNKIKEIIHNLSKKSKNYNNNKVNDFIKNINSTQNNIYNVDFLLNLLKIDNYNLYLVYSKGYDETYKRVKEEFEQEHFKVLCPFYYCSITKDDIYIKNKIKFYGSYENKHYYDIGFDKEGNIGLIKKEFLKTWMKDEDIKTFKRINFYPDISKCPKNEYNIFNGLEIQKNNIHINKNDMMDNIKPIINHINLLVGDTKENLNYMLKWLAHLVQKPGELLGIAVVFVSKQGTGKNLFTDFIGNKIIGKKYFYSTCDTEHIYGRFAQGLKNKLLINLDEASGKDNFQNSDKLKNLITAPEIIYEQKNMDSIVIKNYARYIFTTNNKTAVKIEHSDRRFLIYKSIDTHRNNKEYFNSLIKCMSDIKVQASFYKYLLNIDIENYDFVNNRPITEIYTEMQEVNTPLEIKFIINLIETNKLKEYKAHELFELFQDYYCNNGYEDYNTTSHKFGRTLNNIKGIEKRRSNGTKYTFNKKILIQYLIDDYSYNENKDTCLFSDDE
jgi:hypothetical protein